MRRLASRPPCGPATSSSEPTWPALAASEPAPEVSAPLPTSVDCEAPGLGFLLAQPQALVKATASIRTTSIFRIPYLPFCRLCGNPYIPIAAQAARGAQPAALSVRIPEP